MAKMQLRKRPSVTKLAIGQDVRKGTLNEIVHNSGKQRVPPFCLRPARRTRDPERYRVDDRYQKRVPILDGRE
jgi:hypothetical protein